MPYKLCSIPNNICICILFYVAFCTLKQYRHRRKPGTGTMPYSYFEWLQGFFIVYSTIDSTVHSMPLNSLEHCICTTTMMTNIRPDRDSNLVPPGYKPQSIRMNQYTQQTQNMCITCVQCWTNDEAYSSGPIYKARLIVSRPKWTDTGILHDNNGSLFYMHSTVTEWRFFYKYRFAPVFAYS